VDVEVPNKRKIKKMAPIRATEKIKTPGAIFIKHQRETPEVKRKLWYWITTKPDNITNLRDKGRLQVQFCISRHQLFSNNWRKKHMGNLRKFHFPKLFTAGAL